MQYLTYQEYLSLGGICDSTAFDRNITRASSVVDMETRKRVWNMETVPEQVKALCRDLVELFERNKVSEGAIASRSQTAGAVSESISYATVSQVELDKLVDDLVYDYLAAVEDDNGTPLLYRGCFE